MPGASDVEVAARAALLDALDALGAHREAVVLVGAQAIYIHSGEAPVALAPYTKDTDLAIDARALRDDPRIERAMTAAGFALDPVANEPGTWISPGGAPRSASSTRSRSGGRTRGG